MSPTGLSTVIDLTALEEKEAKALVLRLSSKRQLSRLSERQATRLAECCGRLPLLIELTAKALDQSQALDVEVFLEALSRRRKPLKTIDKAKAILRLSLDQLDNNTRKHWMALGIFENSFSKDAIASVWRISEPDEILGELEKRSLVTVASARRFELHDVLRAVALEKLKENGEWLYALEGLHARYFCRLLTKAENFYKSGNVQEALMTYDKERKNINLGRRWALRSWIESEETSSLLLEYANGGAHLLSLRLTLGERIELFEAQRRASRKIHDTKSRANAFRQLGISYRNSGKTKETIKYFKVSFSIARRANELWAKGAALANLGTAYREIGRTTLAIDCHEQALPISRHCGDKSFEGRTLILLGNDYLANEEPSVAIIYFRNALPILHSAGDRQGKAIAFGALAEAHTILGNARPAVKFAMRKLKIARDMNDRLTVGHALWDLGHTLARFGKENEASSSFRKSTSIFREIGAFKAMEQANEALITVGKSSGAARV